MRELASGNISPMEVRVLVGFCLWTAEELHAEIRQGIWTPLAASESVVNLQRDGYPTLDLWLFLWRLLSGERSARGA